MTAFQRTAVTLLSFSFLALSALSITRATADADPFFCRDLDSNSGCKLTDDGCNSGLKSNLGKCSLECNSGVVIVCPKADIQD